MAPLGAFPHDYCQRRGFVHPVPLCAAILLNPEEKKHSSDAAFKEDGRGHRGSRQVSPTPLFGTECYCSALRKHSICTKLLGVFSQTCNLCVKKQ